MTAALLEVAGLRTQVRTPAGIVQAVDDVSFVLSPGETLAIVGESHCGKSALLDALAGMLAPPARVVGGRIAFAGRDLLAISRRQMASLRGDRFALLAAPASTFHPALRLGTQLREALDAHRSLTLAKARKRVHRALAYAGVARRRRALQAFPHELDPGERLRSAVVMAFLHRPDLVLIDDITRDADMTVAADIVALVRRTARATDAAIIWATRDAEIAAAVADRTAVMHAGRIVEEGRTEHVLRRPAHPYTRALVDSLPGRFVRGARLRPMVGVTSWPASGCPLRPRCPHAIDACIAAPEVRAIGAHDGARAVRCHNPLPLHALEP